MSSPAAGVIQNSEAKLYQAGSLVGVAPQAGAVTTDGVTGIPYAPTLVQLAAGAALTGYVYVQRPVSTILNQASAAQTVSGNSADLTVGQFTEASVDINVSVISGTGPTLDLYVDRKGADGVSYQINHFTQITTTPIAISSSIGIGAPINQSLGLIIRLRWVIAGTTPSYTFSASIYAK